MDEASRDERSPLLDALVQAVAETLGTMAMLQASCVRRCLEQECGLGWDAGARMEFGANRTGRIGIAAGMDCARKIVSRIVGNEPGEVTEEDAAAGLAEVLNMIAGNAKTRMAGTPHHFELTIPVPWTGRRKTVCSAPDGGATAVFDVEGAPFALCVHCGRPGVGRDGAGGE